MNYLVIPDKYKGSLTSKEVSDAIEVGLINAKVNRHQISKIPASDGGDGFLSFVSHFKELSIRNLSSVDAIRKPISSYYLTEFSTNTAYLELANTVGLSHLKTPNFSQASTYGLGLQMIDALTLGYKKFFIGLGGSASNDMGLGMLEAMGVQFYDSNDKILHIRTAVLNDIHHYIIPDALLQMLEGVRFFAVNDVSNPLVGPNGAAFVYGAQKGASQRDIEQLDASVQSLIHRLNFPFTINAQEMGTGAAGGTAYGLKAYLNATFISGFDFLCELSQLHKLLEKRSFDYIISGEGSFDPTSLQGKMVGGLRLLAKQYNIPLLIVCGQSSIVADLDISENFQILPLLNPTTSLESCMNNTSQLIQERVFNYFT
ncbi:MAG: glycerate kinase [Flavobacteriia bacterium]|nr:glycerate kinase [Flavobacteriia bacterium]